MNLKSNVNIPFLSRVSAQEVLFFTKHLATMMKAGIPITESLETLIEQTKSPEFKRVLNDTSNDVKNGKSLGQALKKHAKIFDQFYTSLIDTGEESGTLDESLEFLAKQLSKNYQLRKKIQSAMLYPGIVMLATIVMGAFISLYILPQLVEFFGSFQIDLPFTTKILVIFSNIMKSYGVIIFGIIGVLAILLYALSKNTKVKPIWHYWILKLPLFGKLLAYGQLARFSRNLGTLLKSGVPVTRAIDVTSDTLTNVVFRKELMDVSGSLTKGKNIGETMADGKHNLFPPLVHRMISVGEKTGKLDETLLYLADFYEEEIDDISKNMGTIIEPILLIFIGLVVGFVALSIISPIYQLTGSIRR